MNHISDTTDIGITFQMTLDAFLDRNTSGKGYKSEYVSRRTEKAGGSQSLPQLAKETDDCKRSAGDLHRLYRGLPSAGNQ